MVTVSASKHESIRHMQGAQLQSKRLGCARSTRRPLFLIHITVQRERHITTWTTATEIHTGAYKPIYAIYPQKKHAYTVVVNRLALQTMDLHCIANGLRAILGSNPSKHIIHRFFRRTESEEE